MTTGNYSHCISSHQDSKSKSYCYRRYWGCKEWRIIDFSQASNKKKNHCGDHFWEEVCRPHQILSINHFCNRLVELAESNWTELFFRTALLRRLQFINNRCDWAQFSYNLNEPSAFFFVISQKPFTFNKSLLKPSKKTLKFAYEW